MKTIVLIYVIITGGMHTDAATSGSVDGFSSMQACAVAAETLKTKIQTAGPVDFYGVCVRQN